MIIEQSKMRRTISVPVELDLYDIIDKLAKEEDVSRTVIVRRALNKCYRREENLAEN